MLRYLLLDGSDPKAYVIHLLLCLPIILLALSLHESAHGYVAYKLGDPTARNLGRLTLNPLKHLDPIGFLCMLLAGIGWAKPVPINTRNFKKPRRDMAISAAAGPLSNILLAVIFAAFLKIYSLVYADIFIYLTNLYISNPDIESTIVILDNMFYLLGVFLNYGIILNISLAVFNLLPVPPFDGSRLFYVFLPPKLYFGVMKYERVIHMAILLLMVFGVLSPVISLISDALTSLIAFVFQIPAGFIL